mgnify:CR=1 FL=1
MNAEKTITAGRRAQIEESRLNRESWRIREQPNRKRIFKRLFYLPLSQRTASFKRRIIPIELHFGSLVSNSPMQCNYNVFTLEHGLASTIIS